jgi:hypothetical protein
VQSKFVKGDASVEQTQKAVLVDHQPAPKLYIFQESKTQGVPYADSFLIHVAVELSPNVEDGKTKISYSAWVLWTKSPPRLFRGKIERGSVAGVEESFRLLMAEAEAHLHGSSSLSSSSSSRTLKLAPQAKAAVPTSGVVEPVSVGKPVVKSAVPSADNLLVNPRLAYTILAALLMSIFVNIILAVWR